MKIVFFHFQPVLLIFFDSSPAYSRIHLHEKSDVGHAAFYGESIDHSYWLAQPSSVSLIRYAGVDKSVAYDYLAFRECRSYDLGDMLRSCSRVKQCFRHIRHFSEISVKNYFPEFFAYRRSSRFSRKDDIYSLFLKKSFYILYLRRFSRTVRSLYGNEQTLSHRLLRVYNIVSWYPVQNTWAFTQHSGTPCPA